MSTDIDTIEKKRKQEQQIVHEMIRLYCRKHHTRHTQDNTDRTSRTDLCPQCLVLAEYATARSEHCPFIETKTFCSNCKVHCYRPEMREQIRQVMKYSGPRMIFHHPVMAIRHVVAQMKQ